MKKLIMLSILAFIALANQDYEKQKPKFKGAFFSGNHEASDSVFIPVFGTETIDTPVVGITFGFEKKFDEKFSLNYNFRITRGNKTYSGVKLEIETFSHSLYGKFEFSPFKNDTKNTLNPYVLLGFSFTDIFVKIDDYYLDDSDSDIDYGIGFEAKINKKSTFISEYLSDNDSYGIRVGIEVEFNKQSIIGIGYSLSKIRSADSRLTGLELTVESKF